jgi:ATP-dependent Clp protease adapter protein ClpS
VTFFGALALFGVLLAAGMVLYLPFFVWFRWRAWKNRKQVQHAMRTTKVGWLLLVIQLGMLLGGFATAQLAPSSYVGAALLAHPLGCFVLFGLIAHGIERLALRLGFPSSFNVVAIHEPDGFGTTEAPAPPLRTTPDDTGHFKIAVIAGAPVLVHWSFPAGGLLLSALVGFRTMEAVAYCVAYTTLIAIHELGHLFAARSLGLKVFAVRISGLGGLCQFERPQAMRDSALVTSGGLLGQLVLLAVMVPIVLLAGEPQAPVAKAFVNTFVTYNLVMLAINVIPGRVLMGLSNDGQILWDLYLHKSKGGPHPYANPLETTRIFAAETSLLTIAELVPPGFTTGVEILNDSRTPMDFVVMTLMKNLRISQDRAVQLMIAIHNQGGQLVPTADIATAQAISEAMTAEAQAGGYAFVCRAVQR